MTNKKQMYKISIKVSSFSAAVLDKWLLNGISVLNIEPGLFFLGIHQTHADDE